MLHLLVSKQHYVRFFRTFQKNYQRPAGATVQAVVKDAKRQHLVVVPQIMLSEGRFTWPQSNQSSMENVRCSNAIFLLFNTMILSTP